MGIRISYYDNFSYHIMNLSRLMCPSESESFLNLRVLESEQRILETSFHDSKSFGES